MLATKLCGAYEATFEFISGNAQVNLATSRRQHPFYVDL